MFPIIGIVLLLCFTIAPISPSVLLCFLMGAVLILSLIHISLLFCFRFVSGIFLFPVRSSGPQSGFSRISLISLYQKGKRKV